MDAPLYPAFYLIAGCIFFVLIVAATVARILSSRRAASRRAALLEKGEDDLVGHPEGGHHPRQAYRVITVLNWPNEPPPPPYTQLPSKHRTDSGSSSDSAQSKP